MKKIDVSYAGWPTKMREASAMCCGQHILVLTFLCHFLLVKQKKVE